MINSVNNDVKNISASIISAQATLNNKLNDIDVLIGNLTSELNNISTKLDFFITEMKVMAIKVGDICDGTTEVVDCNKSYDSRWKSGLPQSTKEAIKDAIKKIKEGLEDIQDIDISDACKNIFGGCTTNHSQCSTNYGNETEEGPTDRPTCSETYCNGYFYGGGDKCIGVYCARGHSGCVSSYCSQEVKQEPCTQGFDTGIECKNSFEGMGDDGFKCTVLFSEGGCPASFTCGYQYSDTGLTCDFWSCADYLTECGDDYDTTGIINTCASNYDDGKTSCSASFTDDGTGTVDCGTGYTGEGIEGCDGYSGDGTTKFKCLSSFDSEGGSCSSMFTETDIEHVTCISNFESIVGGCDNGYISDGGTKVCQSGHSIGGESCSSGYYSGDGTTICNGNVQSSCTDTCYGVFESHCSPCVLAYTVPNPPECQTGFCDPFNIVMPT